MFEGVRSLKHRISTVGFLFSKTQVELIACLAVLLYLVDTSDLIATNYTDM